MGQVEPVTYLQLEEVLPRIYNFGSRVVGEPHGLALHVVHEAIQVIPRIRDADNANSRGVPNIRRIQLSRGNVEVHTQAVFQAANHLALIFERLRVFDAQLKCEESDHNQKPTE